MDSARMTPLHLAAKNDCSNCVKSLHQAAINSEANFVSNLNQRDADGQTPLILAIRKSKKLANKGANDSVTSSVLQKEATI